MCVYCVFVQAIQDLAAVSVLSARAILVLGNDGEASRSDQEVSRKR